MTASDGTAPSCSRIPAVTYDMKAESNIDSGFGSLPDANCERFPCPDEPYIYTSLRYDPMFVQSAENTKVSFNTPCPFYMLEHHWTRMQVANWSTQFWPRKLPTNCTGKPSEFLRRLTHAVRQWQQQNPEEARKLAEDDESLRLRMRTYASGRCTTEIWRIPRRPLACFFPDSFGDPHQACAGDTEWSVVLDTQPTEVTDATMFKIWDRTPQSRARADAGITSLGTTKEVLLFNTDGEILDGSNSTPYFFRGGQWVTPISSSGGLQGTTRRWSLENGLCFEDVIVKESVVYGEVVWFSNAVRGYFKAVYHSCDLDAVERTTLPAECRYEMRLLLRRACADYSS